MIRYSGVVDKGRVHKTNDDAAFLNGQILYNGTYDGDSDSEIGFFAVADGIGSMKNSRVASKIALETLKDYTDHLEDINLEKVIQEANHNILSAMMSNGNIGKIGTTLTGVVIGNNILTTFNVGNSRVYRFRKGSLLLLTKDHSLLQAMLDSGRISPYKTSEFSKKNVITRYLGIEDSMIAKPDIIQQPFTYKENDILLLCSDGLFEHLNEDEIASMLSSKDNLRDKCTKLVEISNRLGGYDNTTVVLVEKLKQGFEVIL